MIRDPRTDTFLADHKLRVHAATRPEHPALVIGKRRVTYGELDAAADQWARMLHGLGVVGGDRVVLALDNGYDAVAGFYGSLRADAIPSIVGTSSRVKRLERIAALAAPRVLVTTAKVAQGLSPEATAGLRLVLVDGDPVAGATTLAAALAETGASAPRRCSIEPDVAMISWTTGSTGDPKGPRSRVISSTAVTKSFSACYRCLTRTVCSSCS